MSDHHTVTMLDGGLHGTPSAEVLTVVGPGPGEGASGVPTPRPVTEGALEGTEAKSFGLFPESATRKRRAGETISNLLQAAALDRCSLQQVRDANPAARGGRNWAGSSDVVLVRG